MAVEIPFCLFGSCEAGKRSNPNSMSGSRTRSSGRANMTNLNNEMKNRGANVIRYVYPSSDLQKLGWNLSLFSHNGDNLQFNIRSYPSVFNFALAGIFPIRI